MIEYKLLKHRFAIRRYDMFKAPRFNKATSIQLPFGGIFHYHSDVLEDLGPSLENQFLKNISRPIFVDYVTELKSFKGSPRLLSVPAEPLKRQHARQNKLMRPLKNRTAAFRDPKSILVENYCLMERRYRYLPGLKGAYNRWHNTWYTMVEKMAEVAREAPQRQQFIQIDVPGQLLSYTQLRRAENGGQPIPMDMLRKLDDPTQLTIIDFFRWLGEYRDSSVLGMLDTEALKTINICWIDTGCWTFVNLGDLDLWREIPKDEITNRVEQTPEEEQEAVRKALTSRRGASVRPKTIQKDFIHFLLQVASLRVVSVDDRVVEAVVNEESPVGETPREEAGPQVKQSPDPQKETVEVRPSVKNDRPGTGEEGGEFDETDILRAVDSDDELVSIDQADRMIKESDDRVEEFDRLTEELNQRLADKAQIEEESDAEPESPGDYVIAMADEYVEKGAITPDAYRRSVRLADRYLEIPNPVEGQEGTLADLIEPALEDTGLPEKNQVAPGADRIDGVTEESLLYNTKDAMDRKYLNERHHKNMARMVMAFQKAGAAVQNYSIQKTKTHMDEYETHTVKLVPVGGSPSTVTFKVPTIREDGSYLAGGVRYRMRNQRTDLPIRKISSYEVALSSYYGHKLFVGRSERAVFNYTRWLTQKLTAKGLDNDDVSVSDLRFSDVFDKNLKGSSVFSALSRTFASFKSGDCEFSWDVNAEQGLPPSDEFLEQTVQGKALYCGTRKDQSLWIDESNTIYAYDDTTQRPESLGTIEEICGFTQEEIERKPIEIVELSLGGKSVPIGVVLGWKLGLPRMIKRLGIDARIYDRYGEGRYKLQPDEFKVSFEDKILVARKGDRKAEFVVGSLLRFRNDFKRYPFRLFEKSDGFQAVMDKNGLGARYTRALRDVYDLFVDPVTEDILKEMGEPTDMTGLFIRATEMLLDDAYRNPTDFYEMRDRGYERVSGFVYTEIVRSLKQFRGRSITANSSVSMNPQAVWMNVVKDPAATIVEESNPIHNIKERDVVIYGGLGGRSNRTLTERYRTYSKSDLGVTSEGTVDSGSVGAVMCLSGDPDYGNVFGMRRRREDGEALPPARLQSVAQLVTPGGDRDDAKRQVLTGVQHGQTIAAEGYVMTPVRTGMERLIGYRTDDNFAYAAKQSGKVLSIDNESGSKVMVVQYEDGTRRSFDLGRTYGVMAGTVLPHQLDTNLKAGDEFKAGEFLVFNRNFFEPDPMSPNQVVWKAGALARVAFVETTDTDEDSSAISETFSKQLRANMTHVRSVRMDFSQEIKDLVKEGQEVDIESILCTIQNPAGDNAASGLDDEATDILKRIDAINPRAKHIGTVERIEVLYNGDPELMSGSLRKITRVSDKHLSRHSERLQGTKTTGRVEPGFRIDNTPLGDQQAVVRIYVTGPVDMGVGDKAVVAAQLKTVVGRVMTGENYTADDKKPFDMYFGYNSALARVVESFSVMGFGNTLCIALSERVAKAYRQS